jgi:hypothetical protein
VIGRFGFESCYPDDAVNREPVSAPQFPANREVNKEFRKIGAIYRSFCVR